MYKYKNILSLATLQFDGHYLQYLKENSEHLAALYLLPRGGGVSNFYEVYTKGKLLIRKNTYSPKNLFLAYLFYYLHYLKVLFTYFKSDDTIYFINFFPFFFFFRSIISLFRKVIFVYWIGDYWPMDTLPIRIQRNLMHYYHDRNAITLYLSDRINKKMNYGRLANSLYRKTSMWGVNPPKLDVHKKIHGDITLCFIGVLVEWQQIDLLLSVIVQSEDIKLKLIGTGNPGLTQNFQELITTYGIGNKVYFPNKFFYGKELYEQIKDCHVGIALYKKSKYSVTYYADPAKIKQYAEFGFPIIMTDSTEIAGYLKKFQAGLIVKPEIQAIIQAVHSMKDNYPKFLRGLDEFNQFFYFRPYYNKIFKFLEYTPAS